MSRVLLLASTTGYQTRAFAGAAAQMGVDLVYATDRCHVLDDPWRDEAIPIRFHDEAASVASILEAARVKPIDAVLAVGDRPTVIAALVNEALGLAGHPAKAAAIARNKHVMRQRLAAAGLPVPWFLTVSVGADPAELAGSVRFPCVVKPLALSGSRGVIRANNDLELEEALARIGTLLQAPDIRSDPIAVHDTMIIERFIEGREVAVEGVMTRGALQVLAVFDKPDPLDGPFFEETIYVTPSRVGSLVEAAIVEAVTKAAQAIGLRHGPLHAECRVDFSAGTRLAAATPPVFVIEAAARPIGGLCARTLRFARHDGKEGGLLSLEELLLRHALGETVGGWRREPMASGVMMIPIPRSGVLRRVSGLDDARAVAGVEDVRIVAKPDQKLVALPEGASYLGFIFARAETPGEIERALRDAHARLDFAIDPELRVLQSLHG